MRHIKQTNRTRKWWLDILYEDDHILLVNKPAGLIVHPNQSERSETLLGHVRAYLRRTRAWNPADPTAFRPMPCNRLDRFTGGIVIFAKTWEAMREINRQFQTRAIEKKYLCIVIGTPQPLAGKMKQFVTANKEKTRVSVCNRKAPGSKQAITKYKTLATYQGLSLVECEPITGRMHQIRAQFAHVGTPILGDMTYGNKSANHRYRQEHQLLFAYELILHFQSDLETLGYLDGKSICIKRIPFLSKFMPHLQKNGGRLWNKPPQSV